MSLKPQPSRPMPDDLARIGTILLPEDSPYRLIGDRLYARYDNAAFADLYHTEGKPALPPVDLLFVLLVPQAATDAHLELLRQIASMLDRKEVRDKLRSASSNEALYQVVLDEQNGQ